MPSPYFLSVDPSQAKLRMFFGRRPEIQAISNYLSNGESILLIGERRMGKTFLLYMIGDFARRCEGLYGQMLDHQTGAVLEEFHQSTVSHHWPFVDLLGVASASGFYFKVLVELAQEQAERFASLAPIGHALFLEELKGLSEALSCRGQRAVVLVDESEKLLGWDEGASILACLKAAIQQCQAVDFILAGDIKPHQTSPDFTNIKGAIRSIYLGPLDLTDAIGLTQAPVEGQLLFEETSLQRIYELTGGKPCLIQMLCDHLYEFLISEGAREITGAELDLLWDSQLRAKVFDSLEAPLRDFFEGLQGDEGKIFCFLTHHPLATTDDVAKALMIHPNSVQSTLYKLRMMHRVEDTGNGYHVRAKIVEEFGNRFFPDPAEKSFTTNSGTSSEIEVLRDIIRRGESADLEFKSALRWDYNRKAIHKDIEDAVIKTLAAFLNTDGGTLIIGVDDEGQLLGLGNDYSSFRKKNSDGFELHFMKLVSDNLDKSVCRHIHPTFYSVDQFEVCKVEIERSPFPVYAGEEAAFYIRTGNQTQKLNTREATKYIRYHWDKP